MIEYIESNDARAHLAADHRLRIYYNVLTVGFVRADGDGADVFDTEGLEDGPTDEAVCQDCEIDIDLETLTELGL